MTGTHPTTIGDNVTIGHGAVVHGCTIENQCLIGMGAILLNGAHVGTGSIVAAGTLLTENMKVPPKSLVMGSPGKVKRLLTQAEVAEIQMYADRYVGYRLDYMEANAATLERRRAEIEKTRGLSADSAALRQRCHALTMADKQSTKPPAGTRDFLPDDVRRREYVIGVVRDVYERYGFEPLETPAFENIETLLGKYGEEGNKLIFKILQARRARGERRGRSRAALRPDRAAGARRRAVPERAAAVLQALSDPAGVARRSAGARTVPRVLPVRHRRDRLDVAGRRSGAAERGQRGADDARVRRLRDPAEPSPRADRRCSRRRACRRACTATRWSRSTSSTRSARTACAKEFAARGIAEAAAREVPGAVRRGAGELPDGGAAAAATDARAGARRRSRTCATIVRAGRRDRRRRAGSGSIRASRAGCHTTRARSWRSRCRPGRQPRRRRPLRQPGRHVSRPRRAGVRLLARARAHHRRDDRARHVSRRRFAAARWT